MSEFGPSVALVWPDEIPPMLRDGLRYVTASGTVTATLTVIDPDVSTRRKNISIAKLRIVVVERKTKHIIMKHGENKIAFTLSANY